jgi:hypothetical protein
LVPEEFVPKKVFNSVDMPSKVVEYCSQHKRYTMSLHGKGGNK